MTTARRLLFVAPIIVIALLPLAFNALIDPARLLGASRAEAAIAGALAKGHYVTDVMNYDDRALTRLQAEGLANPPDILALGSSRMQALPASAFPQQRYVNASVSNGRLSDFLGILGLYDLPRHRPSVILLQLDPWSLLADDAQFTGDVLIEPRVRLLKTIGISQSSARERLRLLGMKLRLFVSRHYFGLSLFSLRHHGRHGIQFTVTDQAQNLEKTRAPDGSIVWIRVSTAGADSAVNNYVRQMREHTAPFNGSETPHPAGIDTLEKVLLHLKNEGVRIEIVLPPLHPLTYAESMRAYPDSLVIAEKRYRTLAARIGAPIHGSFDPAIAGVNTSEFFDQSHLRPDALVRVVRGP